MKIKKSQFKPDDDIDNKLDISFNVITQEDEVIEADYELYFPLSIENTENDINSKIPIKKRQNTGFEV